ncbi:MAG: radical SAM protein [Proteobacteria bacterium]|nr:radical SAM protein [Pseudomonadota bacterium]MCP4916182.1 radical SAM protein [Pseudomonadota bacterium]
MEESHRAKGLVRLTMACNERCPFCNVPAEDFPSRPTPDDEIEAQLQEFVAAGEKTLTISGGEPTLLRARLVTLVQRAKELGLVHIEVQTNAVLLTPERAQELAEAGVTSAFVSLLSDVPELHDELAGLAGAFPRCLAGIDALLDAGIAVTLNPVFAAQTQGRVPAYVDFVAERLARVRHISLSAVQPHGRARDHLDLLPDYAVLGPGIRAARQRAEQHGITLLNPYCGLPLCAGWDEDVEHSVEALDAATGPGLDNHGNKSHGAPCRSCAWRPRCGGAWHAYWTHRGGSGLAAPLEKTPPWTGPRLQDQGATRWQRMEHRWDALESGVTDIALRWDPADRKTLARARRHLQSHATGITLGVDGPSDIDTLRLAEAIGVERVVLQAQLPD